MFGDDRGTFNFLEIALTFLTSTLRSVLGEGPDYMANGGQVEKSLNTTWNISVLLQLQHRCKMTVRYIHMANRSPLLSSLI